MVSFLVNPFSPSDSFEIHSAVAGLTLTSLDGVAIPVHNLEEDIEVILLMGLLSTSQRVLHSDRVEGVQS